MFTIKNENIKNNEFELSTLIHELTSLIEKYGVIDNLNIEVQNNIEQCDIMFSIDYGEK